MSQQAHTIPPDGNQQRDPSQKEPVKMLPPKGTDFKEYVLSCVEKYGKSLPNSWKDLKECIVTNLVLSERYLKNFNFKSSLLNGCEFSNVSFDYCDFTYAECYTESCIKFVRCKFYNCTFEEGNTILSNKSCEFKNSIIDPPYENRYDDPYDDEEDERCDDEQCDDEGDDEGDDERCDDDAGNLYSDGYHINITGENNPVTGK
jgi:hypothetical protein